MPHNAPETVLSKRRSVGYIERGTRWMEKQENRSLRKALEDMDIESEEKIYTAARDQAAELVWQHRHPEAAKLRASAPYPSPDFPTDYRSHLRKGSYSRSISHDILPLVSSRSSSGENDKSTLEHVSVSSISKRVSVSSMSKAGGEGVPRKVSPPSGLVSSKKRTPSGKSFGGLAEAVANDIAKAQRRTSSGAKRILSGEKKMFMHPNDRIWEDPEESVPASKPPLMDGPALTPPPAQCVSVRKNPFARVRMQTEKLERTRSEPMVSLAARHSVEIQKNQPSQSRNPGYTSNGLSSSTGVASGSRASDDVSPKATPPERDGREIRDNDIRAATSKSRKDYSPKLPRPTIVSDKPGRPIVSFKRDWKSSEIVMQAHQAPELPQHDAQQASAPSRASSSAQPSGNRKPPSTDSPRGTDCEFRQSNIPTINLPDAGVPTIVLPEEPPSVRPTPASPMVPTIATKPPSINISTTDELSPDTKPVGARPLPHHTASSPLPRSTPHITPVPRHTGTLCAQCALPIAGRILSAAGQRFHPACFVCHSCHTNLELVAFYPEPDAQRVERLDRIAARRDGVAPPDSDASMTHDRRLRQEFDDGDEALRFYCHLDFHELFSPRCKSCKTPIEGEVIMACGAEYHVGHFFCAQCGDPFDSSTPFVEKDSYAWCVGCHTNRYSPKCRRCRKPVTETVVKALGHDWHQACFVCTVSRSPCGSSFVLERSSSPRWF